MRLFLALPVDPDLALKIGSWRDRSLVPLTNWVPESNYHVTLAFLGSVQQRNYESLCSSCDDVAGAAGSLKSESFVIDQTGYWPKPQILWVGPSKWPSALSGLQKRLQLLVSQFGARKDKRAFQPHITLARRCGSQPKPMKEPCFELRYERFVLYESLQTRSGVKYIERESWGIGT